MFSLICVWIYGWVNNREAGDLIRYRAHYDVTVMCNHFLCRKFDGVDNYFHNFDFHSYVDAATYGCGMDKVLSDTNTAHHYNGIEYLPTIMNYGWPAYIFVLHFSRQFNSHRHWFLYCNWDDIIIAGIKIILTNIGRCTIRIHKSLSYDTRKQSAIENMRSVYTSWDVVALSNYSAPWSTTMLGLNILIYQEVTLVINDNL